jgi:catechol 2,3-dioxygenase-like lactoylglutathione lyase family enzyme
MIFDSVERRGGKNMGDITDEAETHDAESVVSVPTVNMKLEIAVIPVSDIDRAKAFYASLGWRLDADHGNGSDFRVIQFTPPGSGCSVIFGKNVTRATPGSAQGLYLIVSDIEAARDNLLRRGVTISEVFHGAGDVHVGLDEPYLFGRIRVKGPDPAHGSYRSFASFSDPDGNGWLFQEVTQRRRVASTRLQHLSRRQTIWRVRFGVRRPPTANTRSAPGSAMRTGQTGTPPTWWLSSRAKSCRNRLHRGTHSNRDKAGVCWEIHLDVKPAFRTGDLSKLRARKPR